MFSDRTKEIARQIGLIAVWVFLIWLGLTAIDRGDDWLLGVYVFIAATALAGIMAKVWKVD